MTLMILFTLPNLAVSKVNPVAMDQAPEVVRPSFPDKPAYRKWCADSKTEHSFVSGYEGLLPGARVSSSNPPARLLTLVAEFDAVPPADWETRVKESPLPPAFSAMTFSGNIRLFWPLARGVDASQPELLAAFLRVAWAELKAAKLLPGFEPKESSLATQYFEIGAPWTKLDGPPLPDPLIQGWLLRASGMVTWAKIAPAIEWSVLQAEGEKRFPGRWPGGWNGFAEGARGIRFWDASGDAESVVVVATGCVCFTGDRAWMSWGDIFGNDWVRRQTDSVLGEAIAGLYCDTRNGKFWRLTDNAWHQYATEALRRLLIAKGLSPGTRRGEGQSELDRALLAIEQQHPVHGTFPAFHRPGALYRVSGLTLLNTSQLTLVAPDPALLDTHEWGKGFPWLSGFLETLFEGEQLSHYLAWLAHFYQSCLAGKPVRGLALFIAGPVDSGKTFLNFAIHKQLFGGAEDAARYLTGEDPFNANLFSVPIWAVDDAASTPDARSRMKFSQLVKAVVANDHLKMRGMHREGVTLPWCGRIVVTLNNDAESMQMLPSCEINLLDKLMLLKAFPHKPGFQFPEDEEVALELPAFAAFLARKERNGSSWAGGRFGAARFHHPDLLGEARDSSETTGAYEILMEWRKRYWEDRPSAPAWEGSATNLLAELASYDALRDLSARSIPTTNRMSRYLAQLHNRGTPWIDYLRTTTFRKWVITPP